MFKLLVLISLFQLQVNHFQGTETTQIALSCPAVSNLQKTGQTSDSFTFSWSVASPGVQYKVWYVRAEDGAFSGYFYTNNPAYCFSGLSAGHYTFYFQVLCGSESSEYIGIEDCIPA